MFWIVCILLLRIRAEGPFLAIAILSKTSNFAERQAIRETWLSLKDKNIKVAFLVGDNLQVQAEAKAYKDVLVIKGMRESYRGIVEKTKIAFRWAFEGEHPAKFMLKCDDDSFVHITRLLRQLRHDLYDPRHPYYYMGDFRGETKADRDPKSKYYVSHHDWQDREYPFFAVGCGYVIGQALGKTLLQSGLMKFSIPIEDVTVGIWMDRLRREFNATVSYQIDLRFVPSRDYGRNAEDFVWHELSAGDMRQTWHEHYE